MGNFSKYLEEVYRTSNPCGEVQNLDSFTLELLDSQLKEKVHHLSIGGEGIIMDFNKYHLKYDVGTQIEFEDAICFTKLGDLVNVKKYIEGNVGGGLVIDGPEVTYKSRCEILFEVQFVKTGKTVWVPWEYIDDIEEG